MTPPGIPRDLDARYAPGEDIRPLVRSIGGGLLGGALALGVDRLIATRALAIVDPGREFIVPLPQGMVWPAVWADAVLGDPLQIGAGAAIALIVATLAAFAYVYGQFRRFVPATPALRGLAWGAVLWLLAAPALLPRTAVWLGTGAAPSTTTSAWVIAAAAVLLKTGLGLALYGLVVGWLNPPPARTIARAGRPPRG